MKRPDVIFPALMATPAGGVGPQAYVTAKGKNYGTPTAGPVGTGPFKFTSWNQGSNITISRNDAYWDTAHAPKTKSVVFSFIPEESTMTTGLLSGEIDGAYHTPYSGLTQLRSSSVGNLYLGKSMLFTVIYISTTSGPLANINVRKALLKAIDRQALAKAVYSGAATPLPSTMTPLSQWSYAQSQAEAAYQKLPPPVLDLEGAKKLMQGVDTSGTIVIATRASFQRYINIASIVQDAGKKLGLNIQIKPINPNDYGDIFFSDSARKGIDMFISENYADVPEPLETLYITVTPQPANALTYNYNDYNNPTVTSDLRKAVAESDPSKRASLIISAQSVLADQPATLPLVSPAVPLFLNKRAPVRRRRSATSTTPGRATWGRPDVVSLGAFMARRLAALAGTLLATSFIVYGAVYLAPGSPITAVTGGRPAAARDAARDQPRVRVRQAVHRPLLGLADRRHPRRLRPVGRLPAGRQLADHPAHRHHGVPDRLRRAPDPALRRGAGPRVGAAQRATSTQPSSPSPRSAPRCRRSWRPSC